MARRGRDWMAPRGQVVDVEQARAAIRQVMAERDAVAEQLGRAQRAIGSLQRQLEARKAESAHLIEALRAVDARPEDEIEQVQADLGQARERADRAEQAIRQLELERDEALAERDRERAARRRAEAALAERPADPQGERAQRLAADLANLRRHTDQAIEQGVRQSTLRLLREIVTVRDSVQRALDSLPEGSGPWYDGLLAIRSRVDSVLQSEGVTLLGAAGERFDPNVHEAVAKSETGQPGTVLQIVSSGMMLEDGTVAEPARVIVSS